MKHGVEVTHLDAVYHGVELPGISTSSLRPWLRGKRQKKKA